MNQHCNYYNEERSSFQIFSLSFVFALSLYNLILIIGSMPRQKKLRKRVLDIQIHAQEDEKKEEGTHRSLMMRKAEAVDLLNGTKMPSKFRFRDKQIERIRAFFHVCINEEKKGIRFLMLTGAPGAGKSLCANTILSKFECKVIKFNANIIKSLQEVQRMIGSQLLGEIGGVPHTVPQIIHLLEEKEYKKACVIYIEEIELLFKTDPNPLTEDFMQFFQKKGLKLILIGISNTIDTLLKCSNKFGFKIHDIQNIIFSPYTAENIAEIMKDKLEQVHALTDLSIVFSDKLLKFAAQKLESMKKGDFRVCLEFLKGVVQMVLQKGSEEAESFTVQIGEVNAILGKMNVSKNLLIENLPYQQKVMLIAIYTFFKKTDALLVTPLELQPEVRWICDSLQITYTKQLMSDGLSELQQYSLIELKQKPDGQKIILKVSLDEIQAVFSDHFIFKKFFANT